MVMVTGPDRGPAFMSGTPTLFRLGLLSVTEWNRHEPDVTPEPLLGLTLGLAPASARPALRCAGRDASTTQATATAATTTASPAAMNTVVSVALVRRPLPY